MNHKRIESERISEHVNAFLSAGKSIQKIPNGVGKESPFPTETHRKAQANGAKKRRESSRLHPPTTESKSKRWNDGAHGVM